MSDKPTTLPPGESLASALNRLFAEALAAHIARAVSESANSRSDSANSRSDSANSRSDSANSRSESADSRRLEEDGPVCACCTAPVRVQDFLCAECKASPM